MGIDPKRYVTFRREELVQLFGKYGLPKGDEDCAPVAAAILEDLEEAELNDTVVIRLQDVFAGPALHSYASNILSVLTILDNGNWSDKPLNGQIHHLRELADYFAGMADKADTLPSHLPD